MKITITQPLAIHELGDRQNQEDSVYPEQSAVTTDDKLFMVCDGMGGHEHGEVASQLVCGTLPQYLKENWTGGILPDDLLHDAIDEVFRQINKYDDGSLRQMGTTLTLLCLHQGGATMAHIGDSRIYHIRPSEHRILYKSRDHSLVYDLFIAGEITQEEMGSYAKKNIITRAIMPGMDRQPRLDIAHSTDLLPGDYFLLCSDGMLEQMTDKQLTELLAARQTKDTLRQNLIDATRDNYDNHSAWLIEIKSADQEEYDEKLQHNENTVRCNAILLEQQKQEKQSLWQRIKNAIV